MRLIVVNDAQVVDDAFSVSLTPGLEYRIVLNPIHLVSDAEEAVYVEAHEETPLAGDRYVDLVVREQDTNKPIPNVIVTLRFPDGVQQDRTTDSDGHIRVDGVGYETFSVVDIRTP